MNYTKLPKKVLLLLATPVLFSLAVPASKLVAQSQTETKIRLMAEGLRARDSGDLATAKTNFEQLLVLAPNDPTVQRLLAGVNEALSSGSPAAGAAGVSATAVAVEDIPEVVYNPSGKSGPKVEPVAPVVESVPETSIPAPEVVDPAAELAKSEELRIASLIAGVQAEEKAAAGLAKAGDYDAAIAKYDAAMRSLPLNTVTEPLLDQLDSKRNELLLSKSQALLAQGDVVGAKAVLDSYIEVTSPENKAARKQAARIRSAELNPPLKPIDEVSPDFYPEQKRIADLVVKGRSQYVAGDVDGAKETFLRVETVSPENAEAKYFLKRIADDKATVGVLNREKTRSIMIEEVAKAWQRPGVFQERTHNPDDQTGPSIGKISQKLSDIIIPSVSFSGVELGRVISTLSALSTEYDMSLPESERGVNLVVGSPLPGAEPALVNISLRNMSLKRILDVVVSNAGYQLEIQPDLVLIKPSGTNVNLVTQQFPVSRAAIIRMTGIGSVSASTAAATDDPFAPAPAQPAAPAATSGGEAEGIKNFLQAAGVPFDTVRGASLAYDGASVLVTHTDQNIERIRNILGRYNDVRQVEIEAKFLDVNEGALDELGVSWTANARGSLQFNPVTGAPILTSNGTQLVSNYQTQLQSQNRSLISAFTSSSSANGGTVVLPDGETLSISPSLPTLPGTVPLGTGGSLATISGSIGEFDVSAVVRALSQRTGSDLLSAPKVTVLSGNRATMTVAQELRYPQSYGETESDVGSTGGDSGSAGVTITPGTPEDFASRNVGVELAVTPTVEEDDYTISLELNPRVTEFEGFVEYGGSSVAISNDTTVTLPSGFYQPIFSTREINTRVTVWDGATLVMGGLTREEVKRVNDKVPILGDIPFLGRAFRSKGESSQKRNLLIFVTANLVSPGGSLKNQKLRGTPASSTFQNPSVVTPSGAETRTRSN